MSATLSFFATTSKGMEPLLASELRALPGIESVEERRGGVAFAGPLEVGYRACLWSRTASRVLLPLASFPAIDDAQLFEGVSAIKWSDHLAPGRTLAVDFVSSRSAITHTRFGAQRVKDAVVDQLRDARGARPSVDTERPDVRINVHVHEDAATVAIDLAGDSLHRRGWREERVEAPLKESLAAAILLMAGWQELARAGVPLLDPMCGSGTLAIEAAMVACDRAPGLMRDRFGFLGWAGHQPELWQALIAEARQRELRDHSKLPVILGSDHDPRAVRVAQGNVKRAGFGQWVRIEQRELGECSAELVAPKVAEAEGAAEGEGASEKAGGKIPGTRGLFIANPPYGERLGEEEDLGPLYQQIGDVLRRRFPGWLGAVFTGSPLLGKAVGLRPSARHVLFNGPIECRLLLIPISETKVVVEAPGWRVALTRPSDAAAMFTNRVEKNLRHLRKWAKREGVSCFRVYDADLPEYAFAVDLYEDAAEVQEYDPPKTVNPAHAEVRRRDVKLVLPGALGIAPENLFEKMRRRRHGAAEQYEKLAAEGRFRVVNEGGHRFFVNLSDYLDTGLFLDHRIVREMIAKEATGRDFLNLFCYTATASVYAASGAARTTTSVDLSNTYLEWARRNFALNHLPQGPHRLVHDDVLAWMPASQQRYGLIFIAPPTFSNSKRMEADFDVQRDHVALLGEAARLLTPDGAILFSAPLRRFKLDAAALPELRVEDLSSRTLPPDFARSPREHHVFRITRR